MSWQHNCDSTVGIDCMLPVEQVDPVAEAKKQRTTLDPLDPDQTRKPAGLWARLRIVFSFLTVLTFLLATVQFIMARGQVIDPDIWWHLRNAQYLMQHHQLPRYDMYSFTVTGVPW